MSCRKVYGTIKSLRNLMFNRYTQTILDTSDRNDIKFIKHLSLEEKRRFLQSFDQVFCDCDGVIWQTMRDAIPGSAGGINFLRNNGKRVTFVTNNSITTIDEQLQKFQLCNIAVEKSDIVHPAQTICEHLQEIQFEGLIYCIASTPFKQLLCEAGFQLVEDPARILNETVQDLRSAIYNKEPVKAVIIDVDFNLTAAKLMRAHVHLKNPDCLFIAGAADSLIPFGAEEVIGPGPFISVVENSSKREATVLGKPGRHLCERLRRRFQLTEPLRALFIGDSLSSDISFGKMCGFQTLLVLSGGTKAQDLAAQLNKYEAPDHVLDCLGDFVQLFKECA